MTLQSPIQNTLKKVGIIRCQQTEDMCGGGTCLKTAAEGKLAFTELGPAQVIAFISCGGCPGKKIMPRALNLTKQGAEVIALASCLQKGTPVDMPCPHFAAIKTALTPRLGAILLLDWTH